MSVETQLLFQAILHSDTVLIVIFVYTVCAENFLVMCSWERILWKRSPAGEVRGKGHDLKGTVLE